MLVKVSEDEKENQEGFVKVTTPTEAIHFLSTGKVSVIIFNEDQGELDEGGPGHDVISWIREAVLTRDFKPPTLIASKSNPAKEPPTWRVDLLDLEALLKG